nr:glycosyltransferase [Virgibacillus sp. YIM 98842]
MVVHRQALELKNLGCDVRIISPILNIPKGVSKLKKKWTNIQKIESKRDLEGITVYHPKTNPLVAKYLPHKAGLYNFNKFKGLIDEVYSEFNFTHVHAQTALTNGSLGLEISRKYNVPLITTVNGTDIDHLIYRNKQSLINMKKVLKESDAVTTPSIIIKQKLKDRLRIDSNFIGRGIYLNHTYSGKTALEEKYRNKFIILSVSKLIQSKGINMNLIAISKLPAQIRDNIKYIVIGKGPQESELKKLVEKLGLNNIVEFKGFQEKNKVMEYMFICDLFSLPSWQETFGLVYLEAMSHGKPVIGSQNHGVDGIVKHMVNGFLVEEKNIDHLSYLIDFCVNNERVIKHLGNNAKELVENNFTWEKIAVKNKNLYEEVNKKL